VVKVLHTSLLNITVVALGSYAPMPAPEQFLNWFGAGRSELPSYYS
jgi:hypothetical protein